MIYVIFYIQYNIFPCTNYLILIVYNQVYNKYIRLKCYFESIHYKNKFDSDVFILILVTDECDHFVEIYIINVNL